MELEFVYSTTSTFLTESSQDNVAHAGNAFSDALTHYMIVINLVCICTFLSVLGIFSNLINMIIFERQGLHETVNITLFAISLSDFVSSITTLWVAICYNPYFNSLKLPFVPLDVQLFTGEIPHILAMMISSWLTAYVTFERCVCIAFPLKVKEIITPRRTKVVVIGIFIFIIASGIPSLSAQSLEWHLDFESNETLIKVMFNENVAPLAYSFVFNVNLVTTLMSFSFVLICTSILIFKLNQKRKWRQKSSASEDKEKSMRERDHKVIKMVVAVAIIFIISYTPAVVMLLLSFTDKAISTVGVYANNFKVSISFAFAFEAFNASVNMFVYYNMSSKYKAIFKSIFFGRFMMKAKA